MERPADGPILALFHALPLDGTMWDKVKEELSDDIPTLTFDAPEFGESPSAVDVASALGKSAEISIDLIAHAVIADLEELGCGPVIAAGLSMGGTVAAAIAEIRPDLVAGLVLMDTNINADDEAGLDKREKCIAAAREGDMEKAAVPMAKANTSPVTHDERPDLVAELEDTNRAVRPEALMWIQEAMSVRPDRRDVVASVSVPVGLVRGVDDASCSAEMMDDLEQRARSGSAPTVRRLTIKDAGHLTAIEQPAELAQFLREFRQECQA